MSETSEVVRPILELLRRFGITATRMQCGRVRVRGGWMHLADEGWPDIVGYLPNGRMFGIECKTLTGAAREAQVAWAQRARANNVVHLFARSELEVIEKLIRPHVLRAA